jgi:hypothetical protein
MRSRLLKAPERNSRPTLGGQLKIKADTSYRSLFASPPRAAFPQAYGKSSFDEIATNKRKNLSNGMTLFIANLDLVK